MVAGGSFGYSRSSCTQVSILAGLPLGDDGFFVLFFFFLEDLEGLGSGSEGFFFVLPLFPNFVYRVEDSYLVNADMLFSGTPTILHM